MDKKVRIDLSSPPPVPMEEPLKASAQPVEQKLVKEAPTPAKQPEEAKKTEKKTENKPAKAPAKKPEPKPKKRGGAVLGIAAGVAAAAALLAAYRFVHFWSEPTCTQKARCSICGLERGDYAEHTWERKACDVPMVCSACGAQQDRAAGHQWTGGTCTVPGTCSECGASEARAQGHSYQDGFCTVCGAEEKNGLLDWQANEGHDVQVSWIEADHALVVRDATLRNFSQMNVIIRDCRNTWVNKDRYTVERTEDSVRLNLPRDLEPGHYVVNAGVQETKVMEFWYGTTESWMLDQVDQWLSDFVLYSRSSGQYLARFEENAPLRGVETAEEATRFDSPWQMCGGKYQDADTLVLLQGAANLQFTVEQYRTFTGSGETETAVVFRCDDQYLTMNGDGEVSMTNTLDHGCFWLIDSSLS